MDFSTLLKSKIGTAVLSVVLLLVIVASGRIWLQKREVDREVRALQEKAEEISKNNKELSELIGYLNTEEYKERAAREKLNLRKEGEQVISLPKDSELENGLNGETGALTNRKKWFNYFFKAN